MECAGNGKQTVYAIILDKMGGKDIQIYIKNTLYSKIRHIITRILAKKKVVDFVD